MLIAVMCIRNEERHLPTFLKHIRNYVDGFVVLDDGSTDNSIKIVNNEPKLLKLIKRPVTNKVNWDEDKNRIRLLKETYKVSPDKDNTWVICCDPDERFEIGFLKRMKEYCDRGDFKVYGLHFREIHNDKKHYRCDGIWNNKTKFILFPLKKDMNFDQVYVNKHHINWFYNDLMDKCELTDYNLYHLKMLKKAERIKRMELYNAIDPDKKMQAIGYDYLVDEKDMELQRIPFRKRYDYRLLPIHLKKKKEK